ncbi:MAG: UbiX family flavin prenyltransferase [Gammaproteobacteria bacterium]|nr:UbiX family flavin prenyltransferase [Gammaproteobacteria bacterium]
MSESISLAMTGASGAGYGLRLLELLLAAGQTVYLMVSEPARIVINTETSLALPADPEDIQALLNKRYRAAPGRLQVFGEQQWTAPPASGSSVSRAMAVCPCSSGTLSAIASGSARSLIERAADVVLKERRKLILVHRETPLSVIHLENMLKLARMGAVILPASPGFYHRPRRVADIVDFVAARILDHLDVAHELTPRWGGKLVNG